ncbi:S8/S53 family peptidase [Halobaculum gomorrense]|uniref:S8/S53 family peptidase n=1 Tax=Halobaculum gomorrense TaxID=43928 RepID=UPI0009333599|nr:S8/S53 family peptidase [Halobaculum gomorrense]
MQDLSIGQSRDFSPEGENKQEQWSHGTRVFGVLSYLLPDATFYFYRLKSARELQRSAKDERFSAATGGPSTSGQPRELETDRPNARLTDVLGQCIDDSIDILNISAGVLHKFCKGCVLNRPLEATTASGTAVVAATGNKSERMVEHVLCPALSEFTLSVGGVINRCPTRDLPPEADRRIWAETSASDRTKRTLQGPYCSFEGCTSDHPCEKYRAEEWYDGNIEAYRGNPNVLAPPLRPELIDDDRVAFAEGTSFAAPIVAGAIGRLASSVTEELSPMEWYAIIESSGDMTVRHDKKNWNRLNVNGASQTIDRRSDPEENE